jgi:hypothetical protein
LGAGYFFDALDIDPLPAPQSSIETQDYNRTNSKSLTIYGQIQQPACNLSQLQHNMLDAAWNSNQNASQ